MAKKNGKIKIVIFGCQQIAVDFIKFLATQSSIEIPLVITYELPLDKTYGYESVLENCKQMGIEVINPARVSEKIIAQITELKPDIIFSVYYRRIFSEKLLSIPKLGCVNIHPSILPYYRGPVPTAWAIQNGEKDFGVTIHKMDKGIDTGDILIQKKYKIGEDETGFELYTRGMTLGYQLLKQHFVAIVTDKIKAEKQKGIGSYYGKKGGKYTINWQKKCEDIRNLIRVHAKPFNPAETLLLNRYLIINKAKVLKNTKHTAQGPGVIVDIMDKNKLVVSCADGFLLLEDYEIFPTLTKEEIPIYIKTGNKFDY